MSVAPPEPTVASELETLRPPHVVLHELTLPRVDVPLEHLVLAPGGAHLVETKRWSSTVVVRGRTAFLGDRLLAPVVEQVARRAAAVRAVLGVDVRGILCVLSTVEPDGKRDKLLVDGVEITSLRRLTRVIGRGHSKLDDADLLRLGAVAALRLQPTGRKPCACGGDLGFRRRKSDGATVLACSKHPLCRVAVPLQDGAREARLLPPTPR